MPLSSYWRSALDPERVMHVEVSHWQEHECLRRDDQLTVEEPLEIQVAHQSLAVIMRTPGHDRELAMGFLFSERVIQSADEVERIEDALDEDGLPLANVVNVTLRTIRQQDTFCARPATFERHFAVSASCGLCGKTSIADLLSETIPLDNNVPHVSAETFYNLDAQLRAQQKVFGYTGGLHAAGLFSCRGELLLLREDVGRHNAVDKLVGHGLLYGLYPYQEHILLVSGRTSFEVIQKALLARIPYIAAISAPSSLAVELADKAGITLVGFLRGHSMNVYTHSERLL
jgi:FdhD protein